MKRKVARNFGKTRYRLVRETSNRSWANDYAKAARDIGYGARIVKAKRGKAGTLFRVYQSESRTVRSYSRAVARRGKR